MAQPTTEEAIAQTKKWISEVVVGCNFCPFASKELKRGSICYKVIFHADRKTVLQEVALAIQQLDNDPDIETSFLILPNQFESFDAYLDLVELTEALIEKENYEGIYQVASFHPAYMFAGSSEDDPSNYTNRSPYPMLHFLREESVSRAIDSYPDIEGVPERNIRFTQEKGLLFMQQLLATCMNQ
jgi:uncharacterized protein